MRIRVCALLLVVSGSLALAENKGYCPAPPPISTQKKADLLPADKDAITVPVVTVISDTGYVCSAQVSPNVEKKLGELAVSAVRTWHFKPAKKDGRPVPVVVTVVINFKLDKDGKPILASDSVVTKE